MAEVRIDKCSLQTCNPETGISTYEIYFNENSRVIVEVNSSEQIRIVDTEWYLPNSWEYIDVYKDLISKELDGVFSKDWI